ncbi:transposase IS605 family [Arthrospira platensis C1]|nr:transposase IS605 family [Arthrospira platensis C1]
MPSAAYNQLNSAIGYLTKEIVLSTTGQVGTWIINPNPWGDLTSTLV